MPISSRPEILWRDLSAAASFALEIHGRQVRKGADTPYIAHLLQVAGLVLEHGGDEEQAIAGLLHDAIEDVGPELDDQIARRFGPRVARIVRGCTDADTLPKPPWRARKEAYIAHLNTADPDVLLVSCADKLHNARAILTDFRTHGAAIFDRFRGGREGTLWYYGTLAEAFRRLMPGPLAEELATVVATIQQVASNPRDTTSAQERTLNTADERTGRS